MNVAGMVVVGGEDESDEQVMGTGAVVAIRSFTILVCFLLREKPSMRTKQRTEADTKPKKLETETGHATHWQVHHTLSIPELW